MRKRIFYFLLCLCILLSAALPVSAATEEEAQSGQFTITTRDGFLSFAEKCRLDSFSQNLRVVLKTNIDLTGIEFDGIPIFSGTFEGNGYTIKGLNIGEDGSAQGLFRYLTDTAVVQDLNVAGSVQPGGSRGEVGGLAGSNAGQILNCSFMGTVSGNEYVGGLVGTNSVSGILENCKVAGSVYGNHFVGGLAGKNTGVIRSCENTAKVNDTAQQNAVELSDITLESLTASEAVNTVTDIGGIAGTSSGVIRDCVNKASVGYRHMGYNIGGIAGTQSGYILNCVNYGQIQGRKEVGGIAGQMEPTALIEYEEDAVQILQRQLDGMGSIVSQTASNVQSTANSLFGQVGALQSYVGDAQEAVSTLIPSQGDSSLPDMDTIQAAKNSISSSMSGMSQTLQGMSATTQSSMGTLSNNLYALQNQMNAMRTTLGNVSETVGGSITDVSDDDTELNLTGKVESCANHGAVLADRNVGGIAGAMAMENDLDYEEDWTISGENSLNFESELRAVILDCENDGVVTAAKESAGGIVGLQSMGLVKNSRNTGKLDGEGADYVGGISGQSMGFIRSSSTKCEILGASYVGGIAGSATIATDCRSMVKLEGSAEKLGAILGAQEDCLTDEEDPVMGNLYLVVSKDIGAIDGISYAGLAEPMAQDSFLALEDLPEFFQTVTLCFRFENGREVHYSMAPGSAFPETKVPALPKKDGYLAVWAGLEEVDLSSVAFDMTFEADYSGHYTVLQSSVTRDGMPVMLAHGDFSADSRVRLTEYKDTVSVENGETLLEAWNLQISDARNLTTARFRLPEDCGAADVRLLVRVSDGSWKEVVCDEDGSYLLFQLEEGISGVALVQKAESPWLLLAAGAAAVIAAAVILLIRKKRKKQ